jgi:hypothetical protein
MFSFFLIGNFRSVFMYDLDQLLEWPEGVELEYTKCLIMIAKISPNQMNHIGRLLESPKHKRVKADIVLLISDEEVIIKETQMHVILMKKWVSLIAKCGPRISSMCPTIGMKLSEKHDGLCPKSTISPAGKSIKVSYVGVEPYQYMKEVPPKGSDILILNLLAQKFQFKVQTIRFVKTKHF